MEETECKILPNVYSQFKPTHFLIKDGEEGCIKKTAVIPGGFCSLLNHKADDEINDLTGADEVQIMSEFCAFLG